MIPYIDYKDDFLDFIECKNLNLNTHEDIENYIDYTKQIDLTKYNIEGVEQKTTIEIEVKKWRKFYLNNYQKSSYREFEPFVVRGEIADFIVSRLGIFDKNGGVIGVDSPVKLDEIAAKLLKNQINQIRRAKNQYEAISEAVKLFNYIKNKITNPVSRATLQNVFTSFLLEVKTKLGVENVVNTLLEKLPKGVKNALKRESQNKVIDFIFNSLTDYNLVRLQDSDEFSGFGNRLRLRWSEFLRNTILNFKKPIKASDVFDAVLNVVNQLKKNHQTNQNLFKINFNDLLSKFFSKRISVVNVNEKLRELLRNYGRTAFRNGIEFLGLDARDFRNIENIVIDKMNSYARVYINSITTKIFNGLVELGEALLKSDLWSNKFINKIFEFGRLAADRNGMYEWVYGDTKHCGSCLHANGQRHLLKSWHKAGILPQSNGHKELICGGFYCKCRLVRVTGYSRGRLDSVPTK